MPLEYLSYLPACSILLATVPSKIRNLCAKNWHLRHSGVLEDETEKRRLYSSRVSVMPSLTSEHMSVAGQCLLEIPDVFLDASVLEHGHVLKSAVRGHAAKGAS